MATDNENSTVVKTVVVEDSVTHQAGEGMTANFSPSLETPDIFDNTAQPAVKKLVESVPVDEVANREDSGTSVPKANSTQALLQGDNSLVTNLDTLSDGSVDIARDGH